MDLNGNWTWIFNSRLPASVNLPPKCHFTRRKVRTACQTSPQVPVAAAASHFSLFEMHLPSHHFSHSPPHQQLLNPALKGQSCSHLFLLCLSCNIPPLATYSAFLLQHPQQSTIVLGLRRDLFLGRRWRTQRLAAITIRLRRLSATNTSVVAIPSF